jgi:predicted RNA-binding protein YlqC (UPF0109 family)
MILEKSEIVLADTGPSIGTRQLELTFVHSKEELDAEKLMEELVEKYPKFLYSVYRGLDSRLAFRGKDLDIESTENRPQIMKFYELVSRKSLEYQRDVLDLKPHQMRPPFFVLYTKATAFTGEELFYEFFNLVMVEVNLDDHDPFAYVEAAKAAFSSFFVEVNSKEDIGKIIGKNGKTISAIRALVNGAGKRYDKDLTVEVID